MKRGRVMSAAESRKWAKLGQKAFDRLRDGTHNGSKSAVKQMVLLARYSTLWVGLLNEELAAEVAPHLDSWPVNLVHHPDFQRTSIELVNRLPLAPNVWKRPKGRKWYSLEEESTNFLALNLYRKATKDYGHPPDSEKAFAVTWKWLMKATEGHPEKDETLYQLGRYMAEKKGATRGTAKYAGFVRDGIRERLRGAFRVMLKSPKIRVQ